jgi:hypothetical protein
VSVLCVLKDMCRSEGSECLFCVWYKMCRGVRVKSTYILFVINCLWSEGSECLFCLWYKLCVGMRGQSACFVCGINYVLE